MEAGSRHLVADGPEQSFLRRSHFLPPDTNGPGLPGLSHRSDCLRRWAEQAPLEFLSLVVQAPSPSSHGHSAVAKCAGMVGGIPRQPPGSEEPSLDHSRIVHVPEVSRNS